METLINRKANKVYVSMAVTSFEHLSSQVCVVSIEVNDKKYKILQLHVMPDHRADILLGQVFQTIHKCVMLEHGRTLPPLLPCAETC